MRVWGTAAGFALLLLGLWAVAPSPLASGPPSAANAPGYLEALPQDTGASGLKQELRRLANTGRLMMVVAHPDDEDGGLLTLESRGKGVDTLLLTLTRGEGGQNKTGDTFSDELGVLRTLELLAADRYYGVEQRFTRVADFGYSKTAEETFEKWGGHDVPLSDMVRVIRQFRPDVLISRFSGTEADGHGHHQASAILTKEAFRAAADPKRFSEQITEGLEPWQPKKLYIGNVCGFGASSCPDQNWTVKLNTGEEDPVLGMSYVQFAMEGLRHQQSQGLGDLRSPSGPRYTFYQLADSVLAKTTDSDGHEKDLFDGIDTSLPGLAAKFGDETGLGWLKSELAKVSGELHDSVPGLSNLVREFQSMRDQLEHSGLPEETKLPLLQSVQEKTKQAQRALDLALNATLEVTVAPPAGPAGPIPPEGEALTAVSPGQKFQVILKLHNGSNYWLMIQNASLDHNDWVRQAQAEHAGIAPGEDYYANFLVQVPKGAPITRPYWHRDNPQTDAVHKIDEPEYETLPFPPNPLNASISFEITSKRGEHSLAPDFLRRKEKESPQGTVSGDVAVFYANEHGEVRRRELAILPVFSVQLEPAQPVIPVSTGDATTAKAEATSNFTGAPTGVLHLRVPSGWQVDPESADVKFAKRGDKQDLDFNVRAQNLKEGRAESKATLDAGQAKYSEGYTLVTREDLGSFYYFEPAVQHVSVVGVKIPRDLKLGYIMGAGDDIPNVLRQVGMKVTLIPADKISTESLSQYGTIVLGVRAYDTQKDLVANNQKLLNFVSSGGTLVVQNNNSVSDFNSNHLTPYPAQLSRARVSVEDAPVQILAADDPVFHYPNEISPKDFDGWVQERGLYFMATWDNHFRPLLACHDPNEPEQKGGLLVAKYGKGTYIYTGYAFFRQLPAGVPGAIRLFVNLVSRNENSVAGDLSGFTN